LIREYNRLGCRGVSGSPDEISIVATTGASGTPSVNFFLAAHPSTVIFTDHLRVSVGLSMEALQPAISEKIRLCPDTAMSVLPPTTNRKGGAASNFMPFLGLGLELVHWSTCTGPTTGKPKPVFRVLLYWWRR